MRGSIEFGLPRSGFLFFPYQNGNSLPGKVQHEYALLLSTHPGRSVSILEESVNHALALLKYDPVWLEWGYLSPEELERQVAEYRTGNDPHTEHYRYSSFRRILVGLPVISEEEMARYLSLTERDPDMGMAQATRVDLMLWRGVTTEQFERLAQDPRFAAPLFQKLARRRRLYTALEACATVSEPLFVEILSAQDGQVQRVLVDQYRLTPEQYEILAEQGVNRAIRNLAGVKRREVLKAKGKDK